MGVLLFFCLVWIPVLGVDFLYQGPDCTILYRFTPETGTLHDLTVTYNGTFSFLPSNFGGISLFTLAGEELRPWEDRHVSQLIEESLSEGMYTARFRWSYQGDSFEFTFKAHLEGKRLVIEYASESENVIQFGFDRSEQTPDPKIVTMPYGHNVLYTNGIYISGIIDPKKSNASTVLPVHYYYSSTSTYFADGAEYKPLTSGHRNTLKETMVLTVSPEIEDTFYRVSNPVSPFRSYLTRYVILDLWRGSFLECKNDIQTLVSEGMTDLFVIVHVWQKYGYDNGLPTTYPAGSVYGGASALMEIAHLCEENGYLFALHTNYVDFYDNSDVWNPDDIGLNPDGSWIKSWYNAWTGKQSYLIKPSRALYYAGLYEPLIHNSYKTTAVFIDVHSAVLPSFKVDHDSTVPESGRQASTFDHYRDLLAVARDIHEGPIAGEGFGFSTNVWAGYVDAIEADPRSWYDTGINRSGTDVPTIVDYKLQVLHPLFVPHGMGYLERFFLDQWDGYTGNQLRRYRSSQIAFGNAGFIHDPFHKDIPLSEVKKDYCFLKHLQRRYLPSEVTETLYYVDGSFLSLSEALRAILPDVTPDDVNNVLTEELGLIRTTYANGLVVFVNRSLSKTIDISDVGVIFHLPPNGFYARKGTKFVAFSADVDGVETDSIWPLDDICDFCNSHTTGDLNGDGHLNGLDMLIFKAFLIENINSLELRAPYADLNGDSIANIVDLALLQHLLVGNSR